MGNGKYKQWKEYIYQYQKNHIYNYLSILEADTSKKGWRKKYEKSTLGKRENISKLCSVE